MDDLLDLNDLFSKYPAAVLDATYPQSNEDDTTSVRSSNAAAHDDLFDIGDESYSVVGSDDCMDEELPEASEERPERITFSNNSGNATSEDLADYYTAPYKDNDFSHVVEEASPNPKYCCFCECGQSSQDWSNNKRYNEMIEFINDNFHRMSSHALTAKLQIMYNKGIRMHTPLKLPWHQVIIWEHITQHASSIRVMYELALKQHNNILHVLSENACFRRNQNNPRDIKLHFDSVKLFLLTTEKRNTLLRHVNQMRGTGRGL